MIQRIDLRGADRTTVDYRAAVPRADFDVEAAVPAVHAICEAVRTRGLDAIREYGERFDGVTVGDIRVAPEALERALAELDPAIRARLVSSVLMNVVPAQTAGVGSIALSSPPQKEFGGAVHPTILAACALLGVEEVSAGGAQAIAMFAYGVGPCAKVDLVTGPGNIYTVTAKRLLKGQVGIDSEAGPTEIAILADDGADAAYVAADLVSQAEHDPLAAAVLVTPSERLAADVEAELDKQVSATKHTERIRTSLAGNQSGIVLVDDLEQGLDVVNAYAAEHLEIHTADPASYAARVRNAGAIFVGPHAPVSLGDYCAGSNHVLPTAGCACHSSGLSVRAFTKSVHVVEYDSEALAEVADHVVTLANAEDLPGHGAAISVRFQQ